MINKLLLACCLFIGLTLHVNAQTKTKQATKKAGFAKSQLLQERQVQITTNYGVIVVKLYDSTPLHRDNFIALVKNKFYDSLLFHRVIDGFMIQGGDPTSKVADSAFVLGEGAAPGERIPAEFKPYYIHKKGALAAARDNNPSKSSSNCQFYLVQGKVYTDSLLNVIECSRVRPNNPNFAYTDEQRRIYKTLGGTPFLDQNYTIFGEVVKGLEVIDIIARLPRDKRDRPLKEARMLSVKMLN